jgi:ADP-ribose pyrophosphatase YjhB (NUDIX family)
MDARQVFGRLPDDFHRHITVEYCSQCGARCETRELNGLPRSICTRCGHVHFFNPSPAVAVVVVEGDSVLLCQRATATDYAGRWCLPSGHIEYNEDFLTAALRETHEETGVEVEIKGLISVVSNFWEHGASTLVPVLLATPVGGAPRPSDETSAVAWFRGNALPELAWEADAHIIERYFATRDTGAAVDPAYVRFDADSAGRQPPPAERFPR